MREQRGGIRELKPHLYNRESIMDGNQNETLYKEVM
jgi:hypothetical protein